MLGQGFWKYWAASWLGLLLIGAWITLLCWLEAAEYYLIFSLLMGVTFMLPISLGIAAFVYHVFLDGEDGIKARQYRKERGY